MAGEWVTVEFAGPETRIETSLCARCPRGEAGCCASPPPYSLAEIGRVAAAEGGAAWLAQEVAAGRLQPRPEVLQPAQAGGACVYWRQGQGCTLPVALRPAQCNFFICGEALQLAGLVPGAAYGPPSAPGSEGGGLDPVRRAHTGLLRLYDRWHRALLPALQRLGLAPLQAGQVPQLAAALGHWWRVQAPQWQRVESGLPGEGRYRSGALCRAQAPPE